MIILIAPPPQSVGGQAAYNIDGPISIERNSKLYYYHYDGLGSIVNLTNSSGKVAESYTYDEYGKPLNSSSIGNRYLFTGREYDKETGLYYYRARYYDPAMGRFLTQDPIGMVDGPNLYSYVKNNPINYVDPWGWCKDKPWWEKTKDRLKEFFGIEPPNDAVYFNLSLHASVTVIQGGVKHTYGFGPDPERMFPWQTPPGEKMYLWPFSSPGQVVEDPGIGIPILRTKDPQKVKQIAESIRITQKQQVSYSITGIQCIIWAIGTSEGW